MNRDTLRQVWVTLAEIACIVGTLFGVGVFGTRVEESSGGSLAANATLLAPGGPAFSIWSVIYLGLFAYAIWQWLPSNRTYALARTTGWLAGVSMLLNAAWLLVTQQGWIWLSVLIIAALVVCLGVLVRRLTEVTERRGLDRLIVDGTFGAYLGWVSVATCANVAAAGASSGWTLGPVVDQVLAVVVLAVAAGLAILLTVRLGSRAAVSAAMAWGLGWIAIARLTNEPNSVIVGIGAIAAVAVVIAAPVLARRFRPAAAR